MNGMLRDIDDMLSRPQTAIRLLLSNGDEGGTAMTMASIIQAGFLERGDPYIKNLLNLFRVNILKDLKKKAKINVPKGAYLLGVMDEKGVLEENEVYIQIWDRTDNENHKEIITGPCVVFRNPCFHPGDVRVVKAVDRPELSHLVDVVVFSSKGYRDIPSMCSGGDLDGDDYTVYWDPDLMPETKNFPPMDYSAAPPQLVDDVKISHIIKFFVNYINNDNLGRIANAHLATADHSPLGARDGKCMRLAQLHSEAVDFPKSGKPAILTEDLIVKRFPDFMQKKDKETYKSEKVLGKIFRSIDQRNYKEYSSTLITDAVYDTRLRLDGMELYIAEARMLRNDYNRDLLALMNQFGVQTEAEIVSGYIIKWLKSGKSKNKYQQHETTMKAVRSFHNLWRKEFEKEFIGEDRRMVDVGRRGDMELKAAAWYYVTYHPKERKEDLSLEGGFFSFPWVVYDIVCDIAKRNTYKKLSDSLSLPIPENVIKEYAMKHLNMMRSIPVTAESEDEDEVNDEEDEEDYDSSDEEIINLNSISSASTTTVLTNHNNDTPPQPRVNVSAGLSELSDYNVIRADATEEDIMELI
ncbi:RNA dependent RNA polymerase-domain-containing protein [Pilobolus umbonatus]|nr:RNA dependent RNA polymerase-domain-containing protein [Pilobolus umbonatus]